MLVKAMYRVGIYGVMVPAQFDTKAGILVGVPPELFKVETEGIEYSSGNYTGERPRISNSTLYEALAGNRNLEVVMDYCNIGVYHCTMDYRFVQLLQGGRILNDQFEDRIFNTEKVLVGIHKSKPNTLNTEPFYSFIYYLPEYSLISTPEGLIKTDTLKGLPRESIEYGKALTQYKTCVLNRECQGQLILDGDVRHYRVNEDNEIELL